MKVAAYQAPLLPPGSRQAVDLIRRQVDWCESHGDTVTTIVGFTEVTGTGNRHNTAAVCHKGSVIGLFSYGPSGIVNSRGRVLQSTQPLTEELIVADLEVSLRETGTIR